MPDNLVAHNLRIGLFRFTIAPEQSLEVPAFNKGNMLRGGFGHAFRRLCCVPQCKDTKTCLLATSCPYKAVFEPSPPPDAERLSKNQDIPRPFVFRAPQTQQTRFEKGQLFEFGLVLIGRALDFLPYFVLSFRELAAGGLGLNRAKCNLERVEQIKPPPNSAGVASLPNVALVPRTCPEGVEGPRVPPRENKFPERTVPRGSQTEAADTENGKAVTGDGKRGARNDYRTEIVYTAEDQLFRATEAMTAGEWIKRRLHNSSACEGVGAVRRLRVQFLTPTLLRADGEVIRRPEFHHVFKRLRDRINALCTFFGDGPLDANFAELGKSAEEVRTVSSDAKWVERFRTSSKTRQRHELSGFVGEATYEGYLTELIPWLLLGELVHVGKHTAWGNGHYEVRGWM
jgi:CRISPR/Cas system endoribonuclease Cas6 (RAMP superfamily)